MKDRQFLVHELNRALMQVVQQYGVFRMDGLEINIEVFHHTYNPDPFDTGLHQHPFYELSLMTHGLTTYCVGESAMEVFAEAGNLIMIPPDVIHRRYATHTPTNIAGFQLRFNAVDPALKPILQRLPFELGKHRYEFSAVFGSRRFMRQLYRELRCRRPFWQMRAALLLQDFLVVFMRQNLNQFSGGPKPEDNGRSHQEYLVLLADRYIEENIGRQLTIDDLAVHCAISKRHLNRIYSAVRGVPLGQSIINAKIDYARRLLMQNERLIKDIAADLGFSSVSYFCRQFKKVSGSTPEKYREKR